MRLATLLDDVFSTDPSTFISFTTHGVIINPMLQLIGHPNPAFNITPGQVIPVLLKAQKKEGAESTTVTVAPSPAKTCLSCLPGKAI